MSTEIAGKSSAGGSAHPFASLRATSTETETPAQEDNYEPTVAESLLLEEDAKFFASAAQQGAAIGGPHVKASHSGTSSKSPTSHAPGEKKSKPRLCNNCGVEGHFKKDCPNPKAKLKCYNCNEQGHISKDCRKPKIKKAKAGAKCSKCGGGHYTNRCDASGAAAASAIAAEQGIPNLGKATGPSAPLLAACDAANGVGDEKKFDRVLGPPEGVADALDIPIALAKVAAEAADKAAKMEEDRMKLLFKIRDFRKNIRAKAVLCLSTKNLGSADDRNVVIRSLNSIARSECMHQHLDVGYEISLAMEEAMAESRRLREHHGRNLVRGDFDPLRSFSEGWLFRANPFTYLYRTRQLRPVGLIGNLETTEPWSIDTEIRSMTVWTIGAYLRSVLVPASEEIIKKSIQVKVQPLCTKIWASGAPWIVTRGLTGVCRSIYKRVFPTLITRVPLILGVDRESLPWTEPVRQAQRARHSLIPGARVDANETLKHARNFRYLGDKFVWTAARVVPAAIIAGFEAYHAPAGKRMRRFCFSFATHFLLQCLPFSSSVAYHIGLNILLRSSGFGDYACDTLANIHRPVIGVGEVINDTCLCEEHVKRVPTQDGFKVVWGDKTCEEKFGIRRHWGVATTVPSIFRACWHNEEISIQGRVGKRLPCHSSPERMKEIAENWVALTSNVLPFLNSRVRRVIRPVPFEEWIGNFPAGKKQMLRDVLYKETDEPEFKASSFIKREVVVKVVGQTELNDDTPFKDPRFIQGCPPWMSVRAGPYVRKFAKKLRDGLCPKGKDNDFLKGRQIYYTCGRSSEEIGAAYAAALKSIEELLHPGERLVILEDDQSRFDLHLGEGPFKFLDKLYLKLPRKIRRVLRRTAQSKGRSNLGTKYSIPYTMQSGWPDTSAGDTAINAAMKTHIHGFGNRWVSIICGDDSVTVTVDSEIAKLGGLDGISQSYADLGMEVECVLTYDPCLAGFCSGRFIKNGESYVLIPKVGKMLAKLLCDTKDRNPANSKAWMRGICETLKCMGKADPLLRTLGENITRQLGEGKIIREGINEYKSSIKGDCFVKRQDVLDYYDLHYGFSTADVEECIFHLDHVVLGELTSHPLIVHLATTDA
jgi:hypothetical protein